MLMPSDSDETNVQAKNGHDKVIYSEASRLNHNFVLEIKKKAVSAKDRKNNLRSQQSDEQKQTEKAHAQTGISKTRSQQSDEQKQTEKAHTQTRMSKTRSQ